MLDKLKKYFGYDEFKPLQKEVIDHVMSGREGLVLMPTGGGKSLCYQLPALEMAGITIVVSPLIALMKDQVDALRANGIPAAYINSSLDYAEIAKVERAAQSGEIKLLYLAPERLAIPRVQEFLVSLKVSLFAVDEAHCISEWGHDFRPDYRNLRAVRELFPCAPVLALTATANKRVKEDILDQLKLRDAKVFQSSFDRPNLSYRVMPKKQVLQKLVRFLQNDPNQSAIIYCLSRKRTEKMAADLKANGINAAFYHAGMEADRRSRVQEAFIKDKVSVICATIAFGMGIDKPDVRLVAHVDMPKSVEGYYQETGRAGRDGLPSKCILFFSKGDMFKHEYFIRMMDSALEQTRARKQLQDVVEYGELKNCRRSYLLEYFGEEYSKNNCGGCDVCVPVVAEKTFSAGAEVESFDEELFEILRGLRREIAEGRGVPPYVIFGDKSLQQMALYYPQSEESMGQIFGVGKEKLAQYGEEFLTYIKAYCEDKDLQENMPQFVESRTIFKTAVSSTVMMSVDLFNKKKSLDEVANLRGLKPLSVLEHLEKALDSGVNVDASHLTFNEDRLIAIVEAFKTSGGYLLSPVKEKLGDDFGYDELRLARLIIKSQITNDK
ncbi:MAG: RecQ family ATP-dependent DNA helicase [Patescibacteria group bacterium]|nr:RecQ family ATP-dependent DNA helicase [Patescibacteria group bacterium]